MSKKIISLALVVVMLFSFTVSAFAAATPTGTQYTESVTLSTLTDTQEAKLTSLVKADAVFFSVIKFKLDRSVYYDPIITSISANGDGTYQLNVRSGFTMLFYYTVKIYMAADGVTISDMTYVDQYGEEHDTTEDIDDEDEFYRQPSLLVGLVSYGLDYVKNIIVEYFSGLFA